MWTPTRTDWFDPSGEPVVGYIASNSPTRDGSHYGWIELQSTYDPAANSFHVRLLGYAYEDQPGVPIAAGDEGRNCPGDIDNDGVVSLSDLSQLLSHFGTPSGATFEDGDGAVDLSHLSQKLALFGTVCE